MAEFQLRRMSSARTTDDLGDRCDCPDCHRLRKDSRTQKLMLLRYLEEQAGVAS